MEPAPGRARTAESGSATRRRPGSAHAAYTSGLVMAVPKAITRPPSLGSPRLMWNGKRVSVVLMTYAERDSIRGVIEGFLGTGYVDEVLVIDNNAQPGTREEVARTPARLVHEPNQGYGHATR